MKKLIKIVGLGFLGLVILMFTIRFINGDKPSPTPATSSTPNEQQIKDGAYYTAKNIVLQTLKAPSTATFPEFSYTFNSMGENKYNIVSYVDAQNSFGAKLRSNWIMVMQYKGGQPYDANNWTVEELSIDGKQYISSK